MSVIQNAVIERWNRGESPDVIAYALRLTVNFVRLTIAQFED